MQSLRWLLYVPTCLSGTDCDVYAVDDAIIYSCSRRPSPDPKKSHSTDSLNSMSDVGRKVPPPLRSALEGEEGLYYPEVEEMRVSPLVSRKGYVNFLEDKKEKVLVVFIHCYLGFMSCILIC